MTNILKKKERKIVVGKPQKLFLMGVLPGIIKKDNAFCFYNFNNKEMVK